MRRPFIVIATVGAMLSWCLACYDPKSPNLPPCPDGGDGYTSPSGCFTQTFDGGRDAR